MDTQSITEKWQIHRSKNPFWVKYSNGRFGLSVQKRIYQSLSAFNDGAKWKPFGERIGLWREEPSFPGFFGRLDITFDLKAPIGHLPSCIYKHGERLLSRGDL